MELGKVADDVWEKGVKEKGLHSKLLDLVGQHHRDLAISQITGVLFTGSETTANVLAETLHKLSLYPHTQSKLRDELRTFVEKNGRDIVYEDLISSTALPYLDAVTKESLRALANVPQLSRRAKHSDVIPLEYAINVNGRLTNEIKVEAGQIVHISLRDGVNTSPRLWGPDAKEFKPERWLAELPEEAKKIQTPNHILTFGDGPKMCLGRIFATHEFKIILSTLLPAFEFLPSTVEAEKHIVYHLTGPTIKPKVKGRENQGATLPLTVKLLE